MPVTVVTALLFSARLSAALAPPPLLVMTGAVFGLATRRLAPNSEVLPAPSVAVAVSALPTLTPVTARLPLKLPLASAVSVPRVVWPSP